MAFQKRIGVFGLIPYAPGEKIATKFEDAGLRWMFDEGAPSSITSYWRDATGGEVDLSNTDVFGFLIAENAGLAQAVMGPNRGDAAQGACNFVQDLGNNLEGYDALVFFIGGRGVNAGATGVRVDGKLKPAALLDDRGQHNFICHEIGHIIGADHSYRPGWQNPVAGILYGEYGDAYDIMSARTYGGRASTFKLEHDPKSGINETAVIWTEAGPGVSPATIWRYMSNFPAAQPWMKLLPASAPATSVRLERAGAAGTKLVAMPFKNGGGFFAVEYRSNQFWDRGLVSDRTDTTDSPGVVIHTIRDLGTPADGNTFPRLQQVAYETTIPVPTLGDTDWTNGQIAVRISDVANNQSAVTVLVGETIPGMLQTSPEVTLGDVSETRRPGGPVELVLVGPNCGKQTYECEYVDTAQRVSATLSASGFDNPQFLFNVNGTNIGTWSTTDGATQTGSVAFTADVEVPTGYHSANTITQNIMASYSITANALTLDLPGGAGRYRMNMTFTTSERNDVNKQAASSYPVDPVTSRFDIPQAARDAMQQCKDFLDRKGQQQQDPRKIDPLGPITRLEDKIDIIRGLERNPRLHRSVERDVAEQLGVHTQQIRDLGKRLGGNVR